MNPSVSSLLVSSNPLSRQGKGSTSITWTACLWKYLSTPRVFSWICVAHFLVFCIGYCGPLLVILLSAIVLSVLRFTGSDLQIFLIFQKIQICCMSPEIFYRGSCYSIFSFIPVTFHNKLSTKLKTTIKTLFNIPFLYIVHLFSNWCLNER